MIADLLANLQGFFERLSFFDVVDILLVAFLLYRVLSLVKGTRAMQMGVGLALLFVVYQVARRFGLITLWSILDAALTYIVLIIVVLFQNDIRRALMRVGRRPLLKSGRSARDTHVFEEVIKATNALAQKRIGALVVFERDAMLDEFIEPGVELDSAVTKELLYSVFIPSFENPMHDGAVIIREGRIWQAGAFLPLTASPKLDRALGTRHRAAIGISEETDAVVVIVSEDRGAISICFNGNIIRDLEPTTLREALFGLFYRSPTRRGTAEDRATDAGEPKRDGESDDESPSGSDDSDERPVPSTASSGGVTAVASVSAATVGPVVARAATGVEKIEETPT